MFKMSELIDTSIYSHLNLIHKWIYIYFQHKAVFKLLILKFSSKFKSNVIKVIIILKPIFT